MSNRDRDDRDTAEHLAVKYVLRTLHLDPAVTTRILSGMTNTQLEDLHRDATTLVERIRVHMATRGLPT